MSDLFRVLIAYDGSPCADAMLISLPQLGLPANVEALIISVADRWLPPPSVYEFETSPVQPVGIEVAKVLTGIAEKQINAALPLWKTHTEALTGSPARLILRRAKEWGAQLLVVGATGHTALARLFVGSVSYKLANEAPCSVRVVRPPSADSGLLLVGYDGSPGADAAVAAVASRSWPKGTRATLLMATGSEHAPHGDHPNLQSPAYAARILAPVREQLERAGLAVSTTTLDGDAKHVLLDQAAKTNADCIFVGANEHPFLERLLLGTVSGALVARAPCSVEVIR